MTFGFIKAEKGSFSITRLYHDLGVSQSVFFTSQDGPSHRRKQQDMVYPGHIRRACVLSNGTCGSPRLRPATSSMTAMKSGVTPPNEQDLIVVSIRKGDRNTEPSKVVDWITFLMYDHCGSLR